MRTDCFLNTATQKVLLVLVDGFRWDSFGLDLPSLRRFENNGVRADWLNSVFVSYLTPCAYSMTTGLYPESHGVIHYLYFNETTHTSTTRFEDVFNITEFFDTGVEPLWVTAKLAGKKVASVMWMGTAVPIKGIMSDRVIYHSYYRWSYKNYSMTARVKDAVSWLAEEDFDLALVYLDQPDWVLHENRIETERAQSAFWEVDETLNALLDEADRRGLWDTLNVIITSDHGHVNVDPKKYIILTDYIDEEDIDFSVMYGSVLFQLTPKGGAKDKVLRALQSAHPALYVYSKEEFPEHFHYANHPRNLPIIGYVEVGWHVHMHPFDPSKDSLHSQSDHGYDPFSMEMRAIFYARGPAFKNNYRARALEMVDIYPMVCDILNIEAAPNNGSRERYVSMMKETQDNNWNNTRLLLVTISLAAVVYFAINFCLPPKRVTTKSKKAD